VVDDDGDASELIIDVMFHYEPRDSANKVPSFEKDSSLLKLVKVL